MAKETKDKASPPTTEPPSDTPQENPVIEPPIIPDANPDDLPAGTPSTEETASLQTNPGDTSPPITNPVDEPPPPPDPAHALQQAKDRHAALAREVAKLTQEKNAIEELIKPLRSEMEGLEPFIVKPIDPHENQRGILYYISKQNQVRAEKAETRKKVIGTLALHEVIPTKGSKLDEAMARKRGFGTKRPAYPVRTG